MIKSPVVVPYHAQPGGGGQDTLEAKIKSWLIPDFDDHDVDVDFDVDVDVTGQYLAKSCLLGSRGAPPKIARKTHGGYPGQMRLLIFW